MKRALLFSAALCLAWTGQAIAQQSPGHYVVMFGFDKATLDATARSTIAASWPSCSCTFAAGSRSGTWS